MWAAKKRKNYVVSKIFFTRNLEFKAHKEILIQGAPTPLSDCPGQVEIIILVWTCKPLTWIVLGTSTFLSRKNKETF